MYTYTMLEFGKKGEIVTDEDYPNSEYIQFLRNFDNVPFKSPVKVGAMLASLAIPSNNRVCNVSLYGYTIDELNSFPEGKMPGPVGSLQLTLWRDKGPEILTTFY